MDIDLYTSPYPPFGNRIASNLMVANLPSVLQGVFESPQRKVGVILVNATNEMQEAEIHLAENRAATQTVHEYRKGEEVATHKINPDTGLKVHFDKLEPVFLMLD